MKIISITAVNEMHETIHEKNHAVCSSDNMHECVLSCLNLCNMDCRPPGSSAYGILQARILEWVAISSCRGSTQPGD